MILFNTFTILEIVIYKNEAIDLFDNIDIKMRKKKSKNNIKLLTKQKMKYNQYIHKQIYLSRKWNRLEKYNIEILYEIEEKNNRPNYFGNMPVEIIYLILEQLNVMDFFNIRMVSKDFYEISNLLLNKKLSDPRSNHLILSNEKYFKLNEEPKYNCICNECINYFDRNDDSSYGPNIKIYYDSDDYDILSG